MYISGTIIDFQARLHQLATDTTSLNQFITEGRTYQNQVHFNTYIQWENIARRNKFQFTQEITDLSTQLF